ncbi:hypothetical protein FNF27_02046 [Cafeteria roenbergensis]|uniref:peptidylprolyl isomerase n=1 Tax=Cafeteria roenbergensis TaxID=33653 RepID=A0A5A8EKA6_CAFRO|nr:hypothetical protein FNF27_02046 [Cafeteria roenbergensis]
MDGEGADGPPPRGAAAPYDWTRVYKEAEAELDAEEKAEAAALAAKKQEAGPPGAGGGPGAGTGQEDTPAMPWSRDRSKERRVFDLPTSHKMSGIRRFHARGNLLFSEGQFRRAAVQFRAALVWYEYTFPDQRKGPDGQAALDARRAACLLNLAACEISLRAWKEAEETATQALRALPGNVKALYRRALARRHLHRFEAAAADVEAALAAAPGSGALRREAALLRLTQREHRRRERALARRMLSGGGQDDTAAAAAACADAANAGAGTTAADAGAGAGADAPAEAGQPSGREDGALQEGSTAVTSLTGPLEPTAGSGGQLGGGEDGGGEAGSDAASSAGTSVPSVWTSGGDAASGLTALGGERASVGGVSDWDGLGAGADAASMAGSGFGLATDWAAWLGTGDADAGGDSAEGALGTAAHGSNGPVRVSLEGAPAMSFEELLEASSKGLSRTELGHGVL